MATITRSTSIARPADEVFEYLDRVADHKEWQDQIVEARQLTPGPTGVGTEVEETREIPGGRTVRMRWRVSEHDREARRSGFETLESKFMKPSGLIEVQPVGDASEVTFTMHTNPFGFGRLLAPLMTRDVTKTVEGDLERLKQRLERGST